MIVSGLPNGCYNHSEFWEGFKAIASSFEDYDYASNVINATLGDKSWPTVIF